MSHKMICFKHKMKLVQEIIPLCKNILLSVLLSRMILLSKTQKPWYILFPLQTKIETVSILTHAVC